MFFIRFYVGSLAILFLGTQFRYGLTGPIDSHRVRLPQPLPITTKGSLRMVEKRDAADGFPVDMSELSAALRYASRIDQTGMAQAPNWDQDKYIAIHRRQQLSTRIEYPEKYPNVFDFEDTYNTPDFTLMGYDTTDYVMNPQALFYFPSRG